MKTIYHGGRVFTGALPLTEAFIVENGRFTAAGTSEELLARRADGDELFDLEGRFVCPGFNDSHMHLLNLGNTLEICDLTGPATSSLAALQQALRSFADQHQLSGEALLLGRGWNQDFFSPATGIPTRHDLDAVSAELPVCIIRCCGHSLVVNTRALELLGIDENTPVPEGGAIERGADGKLNGVFLDTAMVLVQSRFPVPTREELKQRILAAAAALNAVGVTSCHSDDLCAFENLSWREILAALQELNAENALTVRVYEQSQFVDTEGLQSFLDLGLTTGCGNEMFKIGPLKLVGDGSLGARSAYMSTSYADAPEEKGLAIFTQEQFNDMISLAHEHGMDAAIHVIGDGILDRVLNAFEYAFARKPQGSARSGLVHVQLTRPDQLKRIHDLGLSAHVQCIFIDYDSHIVHARAGEKLASTSYAFRTMKEMGIPVSNGTDCPVEYPNPMRGLQCAVTRQPLDGSLPPYRPEEAFTVEEALQIYTAAGAYASHEEDFKGKIQPGMVADFVILDKSPFDVPAGDIHKIKTLQTFLGGRCVYSAR